jgi:pimeloyl-ACP methyl ester carboxylesterase
MRFLAATGALRFSTMGVAGGADGNTHPVQAHLPQSVAGLAGEASILETIAAQAGEVTSLGERPLVVLTAGQIRDIPAEVPDEVVERMKQEIWPGLQREAAALSTRGEFRLVEDAGHYIHHDRPDVVVEAVREVVEAVRSGGPPPR